MKEITLTFNNTATTLTSDADGLFKLNDIYQASGMGEAVEPNRWTRSNGEFLSRQIWRVKKGRYGGTYGNEQVVYAYAEWISPEFHAAVIEAFTHAVNGNGKKAVKKAQSVA